MEEEKGKRLALKEKIIGILKTCYDPEIPVDIFELGLIYEINVDDAMNVDIKMTLTSPACPAAGTLPPEVEQKVRDIPETKDVAVDIVWEPTWTPDMMSDIARYELGMM
jgi:FeS assembly SUF system protein